MLDSVQRSSWILEWAWNRWIEDKKYVWASIQINLLKMKRDMIIVGEYGSSHLTNRTLFLHFVWNSVFIILRKIGDIFHIPIKFLLSKWAQICYAIKVTWWCLVLEVSFLYETAAVCVLWHHILFCLSWLS